MSQVQMPKFGSMSTLDLQLWPWTGKIWNPFCYTLTSSEKWTDLEGASRPSWREFLPCLGRVVQTAWLLYHHGFAISTGPSYNPPWASFSSSNRLLPRKIGYILLGSWYYHPAGKTTNWFLQSLLSHVLGKYLDPIFRYHPLPFFLCKQNYS